MSYKKVFKELLSSMQLASENNIATIQNVSHFIKSWETEAETELLYSPMTASVAKKISKQEEYNNMLESPEVKRALHTIHVAAGNGKRSVFIYHDNNTVKVLENLGYDCHEPKIEMADVKFEVTWYGD
tara:strand:- start:67 stop:450 length:384 start_codon:yes stop_codon:yes gene_type:complete